MGVFVVVAGRVRSGRDRAGGPYLEGERAAQVEWVLWMGVAAVPPVAPLACLVLLVSGLTLGLACPGGYGVCDLVGGNGDDRSPQ